MKYSSKQKLAMAMAAGMVVSMAPAMAFAAPIDFVNVATELGKEKDTAQDKVDIASAESVLAEAKKVVNGDVNAQKLVDAYEASLMVFKSKTVAEFDVNVKAFEAKAADLKTLFVEAKTEADFDKGLGAFTVAKHAKFRTVLEGMEAANPYIEFHFAANPGMPTMVDFHLDKVKDAKVEKYKIMSGGLDQSGVFGVAETPTPLFLNKGDKVEIILYEADGTTEVGKVEATIQF